MREVIDFVAQGHTFNAVFFMKVLKLLRDSLCMTFLFFRMKATRTNTREALLCMIEDKYNYFVLGMNNQTSLIVLVKEKSNVYRLKAQ